MRSGVHFTRHASVWILIESRKSSKYKEGVVDLNASNIKVERPDPGQSEFLAIVHPPNDRRSTTPLSSTYLQLPSRHPSRSSWNSSPGFHDVEEPVPPDKVYHGSSRDISPSFRLGQYFPYPELYQRPYIPASVPAGGVDLDPLKYLPIEPSKRHAELFQFCKCFITMDCKSTDQIVIQRLSSYTCSIDGNDPPASFNDQWLPFLTHSPLAIHLTILTSAYFHATIRGVPVDKAVEVITTKVKFITLINQHIASHSKGVNDDAIAAVMSLTYNEVTKRSNSPQCLC